MPRNPGLEAVAPLGQTRCTQVLNQITSLLRDYYPQALELVGKLDTALTVDFLSR